MKKIINLIPIMVLCLVNISLLGQDGEHGSGAMSYRGKSPFAGRDGTTILGDRDFSDESLFTGDVSFSVPITTIGPLSIELNYNSNVHKQVLADNRDMQAGWVGVGWSMEFGSVTADINGTKDVSDDRYFYSGPDGSSELFLIPGKENEFRLKNYKYWDIVRVMDSDRIVGWKIIKEDGTIYRYGNIDITSGNFEVSYDVYNNGTNYTNGTQFYLGLGGRVTSIPLSLSGQEELISYRWNLSDIEDIYENHTRIYYYLEFKSAGYSTKYYTHASYPRSIVDHTGKVVIFRNGGMLGEGCSYNECENYQQKLFLTKRLHEIQILNNNTLIQSYKLEVEYADVYDIFYIQVKHYLKSITQKDASDDKLPSTNFTYYGKDTANPGALESITYPDGGTVTYIYQKQPLNNVNLQFSETLNHTPHVNIPPEQFVYDKQFGMSGSDFIITNSGDEVAFLMRFYRWRQKGWELDDDDILPEATCDFWIVGDHVVISCSNYFQMFDRKGDGWEVKDLYATEAINNNGNFKVIATGNDFFVVVDVDDEAQYSFYVISCNNGEWEVDPIEGLFYSAESLWSASCGNRYFVLCNHSSGHAYVYNWDEVNSNWDRKNIFSINSLKFQTCTGSDYFAILDRVYPQKIAIYQWNGTEWQLTKTLEIPPDGNLPTGTRYMQAGKDFFVVTSAGFSGGYALAGQINIYKKQGDGYGSWLEMSVDDLVSSKGIPVDFEYAKITIAKDDIFIGYRHEDNSDIDGILLVVNSENSDVTLLDSIEDFRISDYGSLTPSSNGTGVVFTVWEDESYDRKVKYYIARGDSWIEGDGGVIYSNTTTTFGQSGSDFFGTVSLDGKVSAFKQGFDENHQIKVTGHPYDYPVYQKIVNDGINDPVTTYYAFINGVYDTGMNSAKYNQSRVTLPGQSGIMVKYYYNDLNENEVSCTEGFDASINYKELDGKPYNIQLLGYDQSILVEKTINTYDIEVIDADDQIYHYRLEQTEKTKDGITTITSYDYEETNGLVNTVTESNTDGSIRIQTTTYACEIDAYSDMLDRNMLTQTVQSTVYENSVVEGNARMSSINTYKDWNNNGAWAIISTYTWLDKNNDHIFSIPTSNSSDWINNVMPSSEWLLTSKIINRDSKGNIIEYMDANEKTTSVIWGYNSSLPAASIVNASNSEIFVDGFEEYSDSNDSDFISKWSEYYGGNISDYTTINKNGTVKFECTTGTGWKGMRYDLIQSMTDLIFENDITQSKTSNRFYMSVRNEGGYIAIICFSEDGYIYAYANGTLVSTGLQYQADKKYYVKMEVRTRQYQWFLTINGKRYGPYGIDVSGSVTYISYFDKYLEGYAIIDNVRIYPPSAMCTSQSYNPVTFQITNQTDASGISSYYHYDNFQRLIGTSNSEKQLITTNAYYYSRDGNGDNFSTSDPNCIVSAAYPNGLSIDGLTGYWRFEDNAADASEQGNNGTVYNAGFATGHLGRSLNCDGDTDYMKVSAISTLASNQAVTVSAWIYPTASSSDYQCIYSDNWVKYWLGFSPDSKYISFNLRKPDDTQVSSGSFQLAAYNSWYHIAGVADATNGYVALYVNGQEKTRNTTSFSLKTSTGDSYIGSNGAGSTSDCFNGKIDDVKIYTRALTEPEIVAENNIIINQSYTDGLGRSIQTQQQLGDQDVIFAVDYDNFGRVHLQWKPYIADTDHKFTTKYDDVDVIGCAKEYYDGNPGPNCDDYPYHETVYRNAFSNEILEIGAPGSVFRIGAGKTVNYDYSSNHDGEFGYAINTLFETRVNDENGNYTESQKDKFGNTVGQRANLNGTWVNTTFQYDILGNLKKVIPPLACTDVNNPNESSSYCTNYQYNTLSQMMEKSTPDAGTVYYLYDKVGNLRFVRDANHSTGTNSNNVDIFDQFEGGGDGVRSGSFTLNETGLVHWSLFTPNSTTLTIEDNSGNQKLLQSTKSTNSGSITLPVGTYNYTITGTYYFNCYIRCTPIVYSYIKYDALNRPIETGEYQGYSSTFTQSYADNTDFPASDKLAYTKKYYDDLIISDQRNLKGRLSKVEYLDQNTGEWAAPVIRIPLKAGSNGFFRIYQVMKSRIN